MTAGLVRYCHGKSFVCLSVFRHCDHIGCILRIEFYSGIARFPCDSTAFLLDFTFASSVNAVEQQQQAADAEAGSRSTALVSDSDNRRRPVDAAAAAAAAGGREEPDRQGVKATQSAPSADRRLALMWMPDRSPINALQTTSRSITASSARATRSNGKQADSAKHLTEKNFLLGNGINSAEKTEAE